MQWSNKIMEDKFRKFIGGKIKQYREGQGITQKALAETIGITYQQLQNYEYGSHNINLPKLCVIAEFLKVGILDFLPIELIGNENSEMLLSQALEHQNQIEIHAKMSMELIKNVLRNQLRVGTYGGNTNL